jgi:uncharacterized protein YjiS (DUF1127 family)
MNANVPVLPLAASTLFRALLSVVALVTRWLKGLARARRHRRQAMALAGLEQNILADLGLTRSDVCDAFSVPFWDDPTLVLRERAIERRLNRGPRMVADRAAQAFRRPPTDRPARQTV